MEYCKKIFLFLIVCLIAIGSVCAENIDDSGIATNDSSINCNIITSDNLNQYFDDNCLKSEYGGQNLTFDGEFSDVGTLKINSPNTFVSCLNATFINTGFNLAGENITLKNGNFIANTSFPDNYGAVILIAAGNITVDGTTINYNAPLKETAHGIYLQGSISNPCKDVKIINNVINFESYNVYNGFNYVLVVTYSENTYIAANKINASLPLRDVSWGQGIYGGVSMESVAVIAIDSTDYLTLTGNYIYASVNSRSGMFPTLDCCIIYDCDYSLIENNTIIEEDYFTPIDVDNYLYAMDFYLVDDSTIVFNNISVRTSGGQYAHGTAYPIQVNGPSNNLKLAFNEIFAIGNGPVIGIYSENFYGETHIHLISNHINVTGRAGGDSWALVAGIEVQDTNDLILNNTIEAHNIYNSSSGNLYGISYSQHTNYNHTYNIQFNTVISDGKFAISLTGHPSGQVVDTIVANNQLIGVKNVGNRAVMVGGSLYNVTVKNNTGLNVEKKVMSEDYYPEWLVNYLIDWNKRVEAGKTTGDDNVNIGGDNPTGGDKDITTNGTSSETGTGSENTGGNGTSSGNGTAIGNSTGSEDGNATDGFDSSNDGDSTNQDSNNSNNQETSIQEVVEDTVIVSESLTQTSGILIKTNSTSTAISPGESSEDLSSQNSNDGAAESASKSYEVKKSASKKAENSITPYILILIIIVVILLIYGYKRNKNE